MAFSDCFPTELINTTDLVVTRQGKVSDYGDDSGAAPSTIVAATSAVVERKADLIKDVNNQEVSIAVDVYLPGNAAGVANVRNGDLVSWSDVFGSVSNEEVQVVDPVSGVDGLEHVKLRLGRRTS